LNFRRKHGPAPDVLQINYGQSIKFRARSDWVSDFFRVSGLNVVSGADCDNIEKVLSAINNADSDIVVLVTLDELYDGLICSLFSRIKKNKKYFIAAIAPGEKETKWRNQGIDEFVNVKTNNYEINKKILERLGVL
jgi:methylmalonyl-CoA mutase